MLWSDYLRLARYWADHPPLRDMVQAFLKIKPASRRVPPPGSREGLEASTPAPGVSIAALRQSFPGGRL
jgi:hypothetical protein